MARGRERPAVKLGKSRTGTKVRFARRMALRGGNVNPRPNVRIVIGGLHTSANILKWIVAEPQADIL